MPLIHDAPSGAKGRFGFHGRGPAPMDCASSDPAAHSPESTKSVPGDNSRALTAMSTVQSFEFDEDPSFWQDHNVQVIIRVRPLSTSEISVQGHGKCVRQESSQAITWTGPPESRFTFDLVADETVTQEKLFKVAGVPMVENCMGGYNSCMFAYGQTGSGKTHTMLGDIENGTRRHSVNCGMTPRIFEYLFSRIQKEKDARKDDHLKFTCKCSFLEIYNEQILDLLDPSSSNLQLREDVKKGVYVENLKETEVTSCRDVVQQLIEGAANRKVAATNMNHASSRSHSVFTCIIESQWESQGVTHHRFARLNLVDLAGSERQKSSGAEGERLKEATNINKSLSTLGLVIMNLVSMSNGKSLHVPYRDSKLTFLLQDSLGGNSKTTIIANISPSLCCSSETLSTLKFAQRAKFIKNNAIVNEDASGDVIAMRLQIQQLKKEVTRLRGLANNGAGNVDNDTSALGFPGSPESLKWGGLSLFSPLASVKKTSQKMNYDYEVALVGALKRVNDKDISLKTLAAENQAAMHLVKQREDEIQSLKMRLRFREAAVKRLETVASGKISAETHLLAEKEEHIREIEVLRNQVDRSQEVTRFAMENLQLKEEIRKLKSFHEGDERAMMSEQITMLQNKLLEALDWKLMHQSSSQAEISEMRLDADDDLLVSTEGSASPRHSLIKQGNDFLLMQVEIDTLRKQLDICLVEKENLERHVNELAVELQEERSPQATNGGLQQMQLPSCGDSSVSSDEQMELKRMVDAIAAASQREAEAHQRAFTLSKENDDMQLKLRAYTEENSALLSKLKEAIEEKNSIIEMYERAASASKSRDSSSAAEKDEMSDMDVDPPEVAESKEIEMKLAVENLEHELQELHEENEKLMILYEQAMLERDEFKRMLSSAEISSMEAREQRECGEKLIIAEGEHDEFGLTPSHVNSEYQFEEASLLPSESHAEHLERQRQKLSDVRSDLRAHKEFDKCLVLLERTGNEIVSDGRKSVELSRQVENEAALLQESNLTYEGTYSSFQTYERNENDMGTDSYADNKMGESEPLNIELGDVPEDSLVLKAKLKVAENKLQDYVNAQKLFGHIEDSFDQFDKLLQEDEQMEKVLEENRQELKSYKLMSSEFQERAAVSYRKLAALRVSQSSFLSSVGYFEQREARARVKLNDCRSLMDHKSQKLACLQASKVQVEAAMRKIQQSDRELRNHLVLLKSKVEVENRKREEEKVLFAIDNVENADSLRINWHSGATDLLKSEEEKTKLQKEINKTREELGQLKVELDDLKKNSRKIEGEIQAMEVDIHMGSKSVKEKELALQSIMQHKEALSEIIENGMTEIGSMIIDYQQNVFDSDLKEAEIMALDGDILQQSGKIEELRSLRAVAAEKMKTLFQGQKSSKDGM